MMDTAEVARFRRHLAAMVDVAGRDDPEAFAQVVELLDEARAALPSAAGELRRQGYSWADLGRALKITRASAQQRFRMGSGPSIV